MLIFSHVNMKIKFQINQLKEVSVNVKEKIKTNIVLISGEMGVGKTTLIKEVLLSMKVMVNVSSPTFSIINEYITGQNKIVNENDETIIISKIVGHKQKILKNNDHYTVLWSNRRIYKSI